MQYQAVNLVTEYGAKLHGCKYAIASKHPQWKMEKRFEESLDQFRPYIFLTRKEYAAILESQQNDDKFHKSKEGVSFSTSISRKSPLAVLRTYGASSAGKRAAVSLLRNACCSECALRVLYA